MAPYMSNRGGYWTAAVTRRTQEQRAAHHVERQGFEFYLPRIEVSDGRRTLMFPGYIFILVRASWHCLASTRGIARLFFCDDAPVRMRDGEIESLMSSEVDDVVRPPPKFLPGDFVVDNRSSSAFFGVGGVYSGMASSGRCEVLFSLLSRQVRVEVSEASLSPA